MFITLEILTINSNHRIARLLETLAAIDLVFYI